MKKFYHCFIMWGPFVVLFALAGFGLEVLEGNKISTSEYFSFGMGYLFIAGSFAFILYIVTFFPLTFIANKFVKSLLIKVVIFTISGGGIGAFAFRYLYSSRYIEEYNLSIVSAIILFSLAGLLYSLIESSVKKNIKFI